VKVLFTIGYEGLDSERLIAALRDAQVGTLADVRAVANSRKRGFSKNALRTSLEDAGIGYAHARSLGTPKAGRQAARADDAALMRRHRRWRTRPRRTLYPGRPHADLPALLRA
jgi:uncharacterized protein (DUF488 family)